MLLQSLVCEIARPVLCRLPAGSVRALHLIGGGDQKDKRWESLLSPFRVFYDRRLKCHVFADLREWGGRWHYFTGRYYDSPTATFLEAVLRPVDSFIDVGANLGMHSILASRLVGEDGAVYAMEPNPTARAILHFHLTINECSNVRVFPFAIGSCDATAVMRQESRHTGQATLREGMESSAESHSVTVRTVDSLLLGLKFTQFVVMKIDVEGWELHVIRGGARFLRDCCSAVICEVTPAWLSDQHQSAEALISELNANGYEAYYFRKCRIRGFRLEFQLLPCHFVPETQMDLYFLRGDASQRLAEAGLLKH